MATKPSKQTYLVFVIARDLHTTHGVHETVVRQHLLTVGVRIVLRSLLQVCSSKRARLVTETSTREQRQQTQRTVELEGRGEVELDVAGGGAEGAGGGRALHAAEQGSRLAEHLDLSFVWLWSAKDEECGSAQGPSFFCFVWGQRRAHSLTPHTTLEDRTKCEI